MKTTLRRTEPYKWLKGTTKTTKKKSSDRRKPKNTKRQHLENTDMWHLNEEQSPTK